MILRELPTHSWGVFCLASCPPWLEWPHVPGKQFEIFENSLNRFRSVLSIMHRQYVNPSLFFKEGICCYMNHSLIHSHLSNFKYWMFKARGGCPHDERFTAFHPICFFLLRRSMWVIKWCWIPKVPTALHSRIPVTQTALQGRYQ